MDPDVIPPNAPPGQRVAYVLRAYPILSETFVSSEINALADEGVAVSVLSLLSPGPGEPSADHLGVEVVRFDYGNPRCWGHLAGCLLSHLAWALSGVALSARTAPLSPSMALKGLVLMPKIISFAARCRQSEVRHVHAHFAGLSAWSAYCVARFLRCPFSVMFHTRQELDFPTATWVLRRAEAVLVNSERNLLEAKSRLPGLPEAKLRLVRTGLMLDELGAPGLPAEDRVIDVLSVARAVPKKGLDVLITALGLLAKDGLEVRCVLAGEGPERPRLEALIRQLGLCNVTLLGAVRHGEVGSLLSRARLFVLPCREFRDGTLDGLPVAIMEALYLGVPVVSCDIGGIREVVIDGVTGRLVPSEDAPALASAMRELLQNRPLLESMGAEGSRLVRAMYDRRSTLQALRDAFGLVAHTP
jgi:glycosyltransferase involved in cell wall biosynthesis